MVGSSKILLARFGGISLQFASLRFNSSETRLSPIHVSVIPDQPLRFWWWSQGSGGGRNRMRSYTGKAESPATRAAGTPCVPSLRWLLRLPCVGSSRSSH